MKVLQLFLCVALLGIFSCSNDDDGGSRPDPITEPFFVEINGEDFEAVTVTASRISEDTMVIEALNAQGINVVLGFSGDLSEGTEFESAFNSNGTEIFTPVYDTDTGGFFATSGRLTIVSFDEATKTMSGRFNFSGADPSGNSDVLSFTNGEFMVTYTD